LFLEKVEKKEKRRKRMGKSLKLSDSFWPFSLKKKNVDEKEN